MSIFVHPICLIRRWNILKGTLAPTLCIKNKSKISNYPKIVYHGRPRTISFFFFFGEMIFSYWEVLTKSVNFLVLDVWDLEPLTFVNQRDQSINCRAIKDLVTILAIENTFSALFGKDKTETSNNKINHNKVRLKENVIL